MSTYTYTHKDKDGVLWRFEGGRPISELADEFADEMASAECVCVMLVLRPPWYCRRWVVLLYFAAFMALVIWLAR
jgi:hypothetical protein